MHWIYLIHEFHNLSWITEINNALTQIHFNGTNFFNTRLTQHVFPVWPMAQPIVGEMEMHSVANLATLQTPLAIFFPSKKVPKPSFWDPPVLPREHKILLSQRARTHTPSLSLSLSLCLLCSARAHLSLSLSLSLWVCSARGRERSSALIQLNTDIMLLL